MAVPSYTPGPWAIITDDELMTVSVETGGESSCVLVGGEELTAAVFVDEAFGKDHILDANAALIAAAPELYAALEGMIDLYERTVGDRFDPNQVNEVIAAHTALAKARGETSV